MSLAMINALVRKDITLYFKNRFFAFITVMGLVAYVVIYFLMPQAVDETLTMGWHGPELPAATIADFEEEGLVLRPYDSRAALQKAVQSGDVLVGVVVQQDFLQKLRLGQKPQVTVLSKSDLPDEYRSAFRLVLEELGHALAGRSLSLEVDETVLGPDMAGHNVAPRRRMLPVLAVILLITETLGLASLISSEVETGTVQALLATPLRVEGLFVSKGITGVILAFSQVLLIIAITGGLEREPLLVLTILLLSSVLMTGLSLLIASVARDMLSVIGWGTLVMVAMAIPSFNVLMPGLTSGWIKAIPSYYVVDPIYRVTNLGAGWSQVGTSLLALLGFSMLSFALGVATLGRRLQ